MRTSFIKAIGLLAAVLITGCASTPPSDSSSLAGSSWVGLSDSEDTMNFEFRRGGKLVAGSVSGTWHQQGDAVKMTANNGYVTYDGTISGSTMTGTAHNVTGKKWSWRMNREK